MSSSEHMRMTIGHNPVIHSDFPDPDIIRVGETYYMASTTMFLMPGCDVLKSYDLVHWELLAHAYDELDDTPAQRLEEEGRNAYGCGMWAPSLRYHDGIFSIVFTANDTKKTYVLEARDPAGPWKKRTIEGFYHDNSVLYDDDGRVYMVYGNMQLHLTELEPDLSRPKSGGSIGLSPKMILKPTLDSKAAIFIDMKAVTMCGLAITEKGIAKLKFV
ncbi:pyridine nucleotide-disulfide oxidoreductase [Bifidobacterium saguini DSM 23967]|uniref:Pyridine nucleotide-disulfide oxidoreductase n=1 Tax=Bifidobacterium saguini DSM 23967 TaxID=1437607 RepID=A0A087D627_9BIFI|nr:family 43 glycosylhydrolase [Bifidobacterium saguini]KFI90977.1 pyridine nucleotide-disulfide oxidoreductase [Bifidobacterium saguini DSM 23967]